MIPNAVVEVAAMAAHALRVPNFPWDDLVPEVQAERMAETRAALEAAAPHLMASAWEAGYLRAHYLDRGYDETKAATLPAPTELEDHINERNPYRKAVK